MNKRRTLTWYFNNLPANIPASCWGGRANFHLGKLDNGYYAGYYEDVSHPIHTVRNKSILDCLRELYEWLEDRNN